ncbi:hypothetical protein [Pendulispora albinea]|uniref:Uncharacterized protein n=1 Tax=Pendulispora albinea TaxID=2741071 RepID=A0ABZ2M3F6_9BACT
MKKLFAFCSIAIFALGISTASPRRALAEDVTIEGSAACDPECEQCRQDCQDEFDACVFDLPHHICARAYQRCLRACPH